MVDRRAFFPVANAETHRRLVHAAKVRSGFVLRDLSDYQARAERKASGSRERQIWLWRLPRLIPKTTSTFRNGWITLANAVPQFIIDHPNITRLFFGLGFALELFSFLALLGRWPAILIGVSLILMHDMIARIMDLHFAVFERLAVIFLVNLPWLAALALGAILAPEASLNATTPRSTQRASEHFVDLILDSR